MKLANIFKQRKVESIGFYLQNDDCRKLIDEVRRVEMENIQSVIIVWEDKQKHTFWKAAGIEPAQAILSLDQLHHRIQHEGLPGYD